MIWVISERSLCPFRVQVNTLAIVFSVLVETVVLVLWQHLAFFGKLEHELVNDFALKILCFETVVQTFYI